LSAKFCGLFGLGHNLFPIKPRLTQLKDKLIDEYGFSAQSVPDSSLVTNGRRIRRPGHHLAYFFKSLPNLPNVAPDLICVLPDLIVRG
jgi:hypothetical protein